MAESRSYDYSPFHRMLEIGGIASLPFLLVYMVKQAVAGLDTDIWLVPNFLLALFGGYLAADFVSGFVHFLGDTYGDENTKLFGPGFIRPFREHHVDPTAICRHDFIEINGNNCLVCLPAGSLACWLIPTETSQLGAFALLTLASMLVWVFMTNQFHKWAHDASPPKLVARLQGLGLILSPAHHDVHHRPPHDRYYCITVGWMNPLLYRLRFFEVVRFVVARLSAPLATKE